ncbi:MAG: TIGR02757 family protein [Bacteroidales bacterium]|nr:TIGR02757 family protein [Bacteroidales bacterium]
MKFHPDSLKEYLLEKADYYNQPFFMQDDPIWVVHQCSTTRDVEIISFLITTFAWGNRKAIIKAAQQLLKLLDNSPYDFIKNANHHEIRQIEKFVYRTICGDDIIELIYFLRNLYKNDEMGLIRTFNPSLEPDSSKHAFVYIQHFLKKLHVGIRNPHTRHHFPITSCTSPAKRLNLFLRWMVRRDKYGVDFGIWSNYFSSASLVIPLDVHVMRTVRFLGLTRAIHPSRKVALELTDYARSIKPDDPAFLDYAFFGISYYEKIVSQGIFT